MARPVVKGVGGVSGVGGGWRVLEGVRSKESFQWVRGVVGRMC